MDRHVRGYDADADLEAVRRIWLEARWIDDDDTGRQVLGDFLSGGAAEVGVLDGSAECLVHRTPGTIQVDTTVLPLCAVTAVTTSHVGRRRGLASTLTARALRHGAESGAAVAALGMFEQGFYDRFGFGTGSYVNRFRFDPASLRVGHVPHRPPVRLTADDAEEMQAALARRLGHHGAVVLDAPRLMAAELGFLDHPFALGHRDTDGALTHFVAGSLKDEHGPFEISVMAYRDGTELLELLRLLRELGDQIHAVDMTEPPHVQLQVLIDQPSRQRSTTRGGHLESGTRTIAWSQARLLDLEAGAAAIRWDGRPIEFDVELIDPVAGHLPDDGGWRGLSGRWTVTLGDPSAVSPPRRGDRPLLRCSVGTFTRLWFGVAPASALVLTDGLQAPPDLCSRLDRALRMPPFVPGLDF